MNRKMYSWQAYVYEILPIINQVVSHDLLAVNVKLSKLRGGGVSHTDPEQFEALCVSIVLDLSHSDVVLSFCNTTLLLFPVFIVECSL